MVNKRMCFLTVNSTGLNAFFSNESIENEEHVFTCDECQGKMLTHWILKLFYTETVDEQDSFL